MSAAALPDDLGVVVRQDREGGGKLRHATLKLQFVESGSDMVEQTEWTPTLIEDPPGTGDYRILLTSADVRVADLLT